MGVSSVHMVPISEGKNVQQVVDNICKLVEALGAVKTGNFTVDCDTYYSTPNIQPPRALNIFHTTEHPASCFALLDNGTCLVADNSFDMIMMTLGSVYTSKKSNKMEFRGPRYILSDFVVKVGACSVGPSVRGIIGEIEYGPCLVPNNCWDLIKEFAQGFLGGTVTQPQQYLQGKMNEIYTPVDTIQQYHEHFNNFRKVTGK